MAVTIAQLEARARINRDQWNADKQTIAADIQTLSQQLDQLSSRTAAAARAPSRIQQAAGAASDTTGIIAQAKAIQQAQNEYRLLVRTLGEAHPATLQTRTDLEGLMKAAGSSAEMTKTFGQHMNSLTSSMGGLRQEAASLRTHLGDLGNQLTSGTASASSFKSALGAIGTAAAAAGMLAVANAATQVTQQLAQMAEQAVVAGVQGNASFEQYQVGFKVLLGGAGAAQKRLQELSQFAQTTPFNLPEVVQADKVLQTFGGTALATGRNLTLVGDIASGTNRSFQDVALWVGRAYDALQSGRPWGEAALRLQEMGALSGQARARLESLQASGATGAQVWAAFNQEMARFSGLMEEQSHTAAGLASNLQDMIAAAERTATMPLFENTKKQLEGLTGAQSQSDINRTAEDIAAIFSVSLPVANAWINTVAIPVRNNLRQLSDAAHNLNNLGGLGLLPTEHQSQSILSLTKGAFGGVAKAVTDAIPPFEHFKDAAQRAAEAYRDYMSQIEMSNVQLRRRTGSEGGPRDPREGLIAPPPGGFGTIDTQIAAGNQMADDMSRLRVQAEVARQQAENQQYLTLQLTAQNAQAQAQAAMDRLKLTDQTFLQGQVSTEITATQLQTALNHIKLGNSQLASVTVESEAAQAQVDAALNRARSINQTLLAASVEANTTQTQLQTALTQAQAGSAAWINAQVQSEKAQRDAQDKLDIARKAAGLIDQTGAEQRAQAKKISAIEFVKQQADDAYSIIKAGVDSVAALSSIHVPTNVGDKIAQITRLEDMVIQAEQGIAARFTKDQVTQLYSASQSLREGMGFFSDSVTALGALSKIEMPDASQINRVLSQSDYIVSEVNKAARKMKVEDLEQEGVYADAGSKVAGFLSSTADAFSKLQSQRFDLRGQINLTFENIDHALSDLSVYSRRWKVTASDQLRDVADNVGAVMDGLNKALDPITKFNDVLNIDDSSIDLGFMSIEHALDRFSALAGGPMFQGDSLSRLKAGSDALGSAFTGLKTAVDTLTSLTGLADATGTVDIGADLDQFFMTQIPAYADSWETAMTRIGNSSEAAGKRVHNALGVPAVANARAAGAGGSGGTSYSLTIGNLTVEGNSDIGELISKIMNHQDLLNGGARVG